MPARNTNAVIYNCRAFACLTACNHFKQVIDVFCNAIRQPIYGHIFVYPWKSADPVVPEGGGVEDGGDVLLVDLCELVLPAKFHEELTPSRPFGMPRAWWCRSDPFSMKESGFFNKRFRFSAGVPRLRSSHMGRMVFRYSPRRSSAFALGLRSSLLLCSVRDDRYTRFVECEMCCKGCTVIDWGTRVFYEKPDSIVYHL